MVRCEICGKEIERTLYANANLCSEECFEVHFWNEVAEQRERHIVVDGVAYAPGNENSTSCFRGFGGRRFAFRNLKTGVISYSTNLWHRGRIPETHKELLPNTHEFVEV